MIVLETTEDKFGKIMKYISKISEHADCLKEVFEGMAEDSEYGERREHDNDDMYGSRYGMRRSGRRY